MRLDEPGRRGQRDARDAAGFGRGFGSPVDRRVMLMPPLYAARDYVRDNPLQALGIALAAGYLIHMITRR